MARGYCQRVPALHGHAVLQSIPKARSAGKLSAGNDLQSGGKTLAALRHLAERLRTRLHVPVKSALRAGRFQTLVQSTDRLARGRFLRVRSFETGSQLAATCEFR